MCNRQLYSGKGQEKPAVQLMNKLNERGRIRILPPVTDIPS